jgi:uncharacterized membrane protein YeiH
MIAFVASGTLAGIRKRLDIFGVMVIGFVTSIGGGTIRDMLLGISPVKWLTDSKIILLILVVSLCTVFFRKRIERLDKTLLFFDTLGLGFFTIKGLEEGISAGLSVPSCLIIGTITACFGGVLRDILLNEIPTLFHKEIYATACLIGGFLFFLLKYLNVPLAFIELATFIAVVSVRFAGIKTNFTLPNIEP